MEQSRRFWNRIILIVAAVAVLSTTAVVVRELHGQGGQRAWQGSSSIPSDMFLEASAGLLPGIAVFDKFGKNADIDTSTDPEDIWGGGGVFTGFPTGAAETMEAFSSSGNDTAAGTGARTVTFYNMLDEDGAVSPDVTITLNGATPVSLGAITYYRGGTRTKIITAGSTGSNEGTITLRHTTTTANIFAVMPVGNNQTAIAAFTVPVGKALYINRVNMQMARATGAAGSATMTLRARPFSGVFNSILNPEITDSNPYNKLSRIFLCLPARTDIKVRCDVVSDNNTIITAEFEGVLIND